mmetsp:Transcript_144259/g.402050  ORF Transcript_144259/g.402050 Transcript_144259/m.402050 type:complete len:243 (+) Transcript_144259:945-1673(+)
MVAKPLAGLGALLGGPPACPALVWVIAYGRILQWIEGFNRPRRGITPTSSHVLKNGPRMMCFEVGVAALLHANPTPIPLYEGVFAASLQLTRTLPARADLPGARWPRARNGRSDVAHVRPLRRHPRPFCWQPRCAARRFDHRHADDAVPDNLRHQSVPWTAMEQSRRGHGRGNPHHSCHGGRQAAAEPAPRRCLITCHTGRRIPGAAGGACLPYAVGQGLRVPQEPQALRRVLRRADHRRLP